MRIELSKHEVEMMDSALTAWEKEPGQDAAMGGIMGAIIGSMAAREGHHEARSEFRDEQVKQKATSDKETQRRRLAGALLRAKLLQALNIDSEHSFDENPVTPPPTTGRK